MVAPQDPRSLAKRLRRLELLFFSLLASQDGEEYDENMWFDLMHLLRRGNDRDFFEDPEFQFFLERMFKRRSREEPRSLQREIVQLRSEFSTMKTTASTEQIETQFLQIKQLQTEINALKSKADMVQVETHSLLAIQALGLPTNRVRSTRYIPVRAYIDDTPEGAINAISEAISDVLKAFGFTVADEFPEIKGSWFKKWFAKSKDVLSQPEVMERLEKIERAVVLKAIDRPQADVDEKQASAIAKLINSLDKVPNAAVQAGSVLVVKLTINNSPVIQARTLSQEEMIELENNQLLLQNPAEVLGKLSAACTNTKKLSKKKSIDEPVD